MIADSRRGAMIIELAPVDLPAHASHHEVAQPPVAMLRVPAGGWIYGFHVEVVDADGRLLPPQIVHHFNLIDPDHRELFLPISRRLLAAGHETGAIRLDRKSTRLNSSHGYISYAVFCLKKKNNTINKST